MSVTDALCRCGKARIILPESLYHMSIKPIPRTGKAFSVMQDTVLHICEAHNMPVCERLFQRAKISAYAGRRHVVCKYAILIDFTLSV